MANFLVPVLLVFGVILNSAISTSGVAEHSPASTALGSSLAMSSKEDMLDVPEWLQNIPEESKVAKYRKRRFLSFPTDSNVQVEITLTIPVEGISDKGMLELITTLTFNLPNDTYYVTPIGRSMDSEYQRLDVYQRAEKFLDGLGYDGHACTLRTICEVAEMPFEHGLIGEMVNLVLSMASASHNDAGNSLEDDYAIAEYYGRHHGSCFAIYPQCPISVSGLFSKTIPTD
ncbi:uncharacterized protein [Panulirus ornatus]|uniref:uncharacterized protein n=1 Tax=Panulirus ornatus TaxID=150431 RepID=UPI003A8BFC72